MQPAAELARRKAQSNRDKSKSKKNTRVYSINYRPKNSTVPAPYVVKRPGLPPQVDKQGAVQELRRVEEAQAGHTAQLLAAMLNPEHEDPIRLPGGRKTFVNKLHYRTAFAAENQANFTTFNSGFAVARRDPRCALIVYKTVQPSSQYDLLNSSLGVNLTTTQTGFIRPTIARFKSGNSRHGAYMCAWMRTGSDSNLFWIQSPAGNAAVLVISGLSASTGFTLNYNVYFGSTQTAQTVTGTSSAGGVLTLNLASPRNGYCGDFQLLLTSGSVPVANTIVQAYFQDSSPGAVCHLAAPGFWNQVADIDGLRINTVSLMYSDRSSVIYSQGDIVSYQCAGGQPWEMQLSPTAAPATTVNYDPYSACADNNDAHAGPYNKGRYIPLKFTDDARETQFMDFGEVGNFGEMPPISEENQMDYLYIGFNCGAVQAASPIGEWVFYCGVEGETESQWRETKSPISRPIAFEDAKWLFGMAEADFENPDHLKKVWGIVKAAAPIVWRLAKPLMQNTSYGRMITGAVDLAQKLHP